jgi:hypothetical protein
MESVYIVSSESNGIHGTQYMSYQVLSYDCVNLISMAALQWWAWDPQSYETRTLSTALSQLVLITEYVELVACGILLYAAAAVAVAAVVVIVFDV